MNQRSENRARANSLLRSTAGLVGGLAAVSIAAAPAGLARAQGSAGDDAPAPPLLGGPSTETDANAESATLVELDYAGKLRPLEVRPEVAAIGLLGLSESERAAADEAVAERAALVEQAVFDNLLLLTEIGTAMQTLPPGSGMDALEGSLRERADAGFGSLYKGEQLVDQVEGALPESHRSPYRAIVDEWYAAAVADQQAQGGRAQGRAAAFAAVMRTVIGSEIQSAYQRGSEGRAADFDSFIDRLELAADTEGVVREVVRDWYTRVLSETGSPPTQAHQRELIGMIFDAVPRSERRGLRRKLMQIRSERESSLGSG
ncbi:MAG: hypothetical protein AAFR96_02590 [Planctomycetota bacterium]